MSDVLLKSRQRGRLIIPALAVVDAKQLLSLGFLPEIAGGAPRSGFNQSGDIVTETADGRPLNDLWREYQQALALYNAERDKLIQVLTFPVTKVVEDVFQGGDTVDFEEASEFGAPRSVRSTPPTYYSLGYSFKWYDVGARFTWEYLADAESEQVDNLNNMILEGDNRNQFMGVLKQIFNNVTRTANIKNQAYNVFPIYNGDSTVPPRYKSTTFSSGHTHFLASGAATVDPGDLTGASSMEVHLHHHGYSWTNGAATILLVNSQELATIRTFKAGVGGAEYDFVQASSLPSWALSAVDLAAQQNAALAGLPSPAPPSVWNGLAVAGRYGPWLVVEEDLIPAGWMLGFASGGGENVGNLVGIREHARSALRGLRLVKGPDPDYPLINSAYNRGFGTGVRQRGAAVVMKVTTGSYTIPSGYAW